MKSFGRVSDSSMASSCDQVWCNGCGQAGAGLRLLDSFKSLTPPSDARLAVQAKPALMERPDSRMRPAPTTVSGQRSKLTCRWVYRIFVWTQFADSHRVYRQVGRAYCCQSL